MTYSHAVQRMQETRWSGHSDDWPDGHRKCLQCLEIKPNNAFHKHAQCKGGYNSICKACRVPRSKAQHTSRSQARRLYDSAKSRATLKGREFDIELSDVIIPQLCPVFGTPMKQPSIDRIDSNKGYIKGNVRVISRRANVLKNNATVAEMRLVLADLECIETTACELV